LTAQGTELARATADAGYCDQPQLTREFRRHWGTTPGRYQSAVGA
jgi:AraC-like DNA-binding protein